MKPLGNLSVGRLFVISAPAGTGKTTLVNMLKEEFDQISLSISYTTRKMRAGEVDGRDYRFLDVPQFEEKIHAGEFLEYAKVFDDYYGTSRLFVQGERQKGRHVMLVIDTQGALQLMGRVDATFVFISPPNLHELKRRLISRQTESEASVAKRLSWAEKEMTHIGEYDYHIVNDHLATAYDVLRAIVIAEEHKVIDNNRKK